MATLTNAPLVEVIFELLWGQQQTEREGELEYRFSDGEKSFFFGDFKRAAKESGFGHYERANPRLPVSADIPHTVLHRFRKGPETWPCYQIGLGIFTTNQTNDGYAWDGFKSSVLGGLSLLNEAHPEGLESLNLVGLELKYQDAFYLDDETSELEFFQHFSALKFEVPKSFLALENLDESVSVPVITFAVNVADPDGRLIVSIKRGAVNGKPAYLMETILRSMFDSRRQMGESEIEAWLQKAHGLQQHAFETLITSEFAETFS